MCNPSQTGHAADTTNNEPLCTLTVTWLMSPEVMCKSDLGTSKQPRTHYSGTQAVQSTNSSVIDSGTRRTLRSSIQSLCQQRHPCSVSRGCRRAHVSGTERRSRSSSSTELHLHIPAMTGACCRHNGRGGRQCKCLERERPTPSNKRYGASAGSRHSPMACRPRHASILGSTYCTLPQTNVQGSAGLTTHCHEVREPSAFAADDIQICREIRHHIDELHMKVVSSQSASGSALVASRRPYGHTM